VAAKAHVKRTPGHGVALRVVLIALCVLVVAVGGVTAYAMTQGDGSTSPTPAKRGATAAPTTATAVIKAADDLTLLVQPPDGAVGTTLDLIVAVTAVGGQLRSVQVTGPGGKAVAGTPDSTNQSWQLDASLAPATHYSVTVQAVAPSGRLIQRTTQFSTLTPKGTLTPDIFPTEGTTVGVGMPIQIRFNHPVANKDAVVAAMQVTESTPVPGGWHWFGDRELHFRPEVYWPAGETVTLTANLDGVDAGGDIFALANHTVHFAVGDAHVSTADVNAHVMTVTSNGQVVRTVPISAGRTQYPTMAGTHIALYRQQDVHMVSSTVGIPVSSPDGYDEHVYWDVNISDGGEFVHAAPWSTGAQGNSNVSHGCINLSVDNATWFFNFSRVGDVVVVAGSPRPASTTDHGTMDWTIPWAQWTPATT